MKYNGACTLLYKKISIFLVCTTRGGDLWGATCVLHNKWTAPYNVIDQVHYFICQRHLKPHYK